MNQNRRLENAASAITGLKGLGDTIAYTVAMLLVQRQAERLG